MKSLYMYFGALGPYNTLDIPGHCFYQLPMLEAIAEHFNVSKQFDFHTYIPLGVYERDKQRNDFPADVIGRTLREMKTEMVIDVTLTDVFNSIVEKKYAKIFLKARFRNFSTMSKRWKDAQLFEDIILAALQAGYSPSNIVILDTDLSLPEHFTKWAIDANVTISVPSVDFQPMTKSRALDFHEKLKAKNFKEESEIIYYGNLGSKEYKEGHSKNEIVFDCIEHLKTLDHFCITAKTWLCGKIQADLGESKRFVRVNRTDRMQIWAAMQWSKINLNVSKDLYSERGFVPARVYEGLMLGAIPVSFNMPKIHPVLSFTTVDEFNQIVKFILEMSNEDYWALHRKVLEHLLG